MATQNKQRRSELLKTSIKRLKNQSLGKKVNNKESKNVNTQGIESNKRIRQKSLSTIFAKKLKETNVVTRNAQSQILPRVKDTMAKAESGKIKQSDERDKKNLKSNKVLSLANSDITNEQMVSFTKVTKQHIGETLLAKKRNTSIEQKKSLSDIFSGQLKNESNKIELNVSRDIDKDSKLNEKSEIVTEKSPTLKVTERIDILNKRDKKKRKGKIINNNRESDKTPKLHKAGGKISSLFGNNPDVPTIGQRIVKPVDEPVFTKITFADLDIHPYMVNTYIQSIFKDENFCIKVIIYILYLPDFKFRTKYGYNQNDNGSTKDDS